jgi:translocation and assembly module TamB
MRTTTVLRRATGILGAGIATVGVFFAMLVGGVALHGWTPAARRAVVEQANHALAEAFRGRIAFEGIRRFGLGGIDGAKATVCDEEGRVVLAVDGVRVGVVLPALAWAAIVGKRELPIAIAALDVAYIDATLVPGADGTPSIVRAFEPRHPSTKPSERAAHLTIGRARVEDARVHGSIGTMPAFDVHVRHLDATLDTRPEATSVHFAPLLVEVNGDTSCGIVATLEAHARVTASGRGRIDATLDVPRATPQAIRSLVPSAPLLEDVTLHAEAHGELPELRPTVHVGIGRGSIDARGTVTLGAAKRADVAVEVAGVELQALEATAPAGSVSATLHVDAEMSEAGAVQGAFALRTMPTQVAGEQVPAVSVDGRFTKARIVGRTHADEPGAQVDATFDARLGGPFPEVDFAAHVDARDLAALPRLHGAVRGRVALRASGRVALAKKTLDARVDAHAQGVRRGTTALRSASVAGIVRGPLAKPDVHATIEAEGLRVGDRTVDRIVVVADGPARAPSVSASVRGAHGWPNLDARTTVALGAGVLLRKPEVTLVRGDVTVVAHATEARIAAGTIDVDGIELLGVGEPVTGWAHFAPHRVSMRLLAPYIDVPRVARVLGGDDDTKLMTGRGFIDAALDVDARGATGHARVHVDGVSLASVHLARGSLDLALAGRRVDGALDASVDDARLTARLVDVEIGGSPADASSWRRATGAVDVAASAKLDGLAKLLPEGMLPLSEVTGVVALTVHVERQGPHDTPQIVLHAATQGLAVRGEPPKPPQPSYVETPEAAEPPKFPFESRDVDVRVAAYVDGTKGRASMWTQLVGVTGTFARLTASVDAPLVRILEDPSRARAWLEDAPVHARLVVPSQPLEKLPAIIRPGGLRGMVGLDADVTGSAHAPCFSLHAGAVDLRSADARSALPFGASLDATYDAADGDAHLQMTRPSGVVLDARSTVYARAADFARASAPGVAPWTANADVKLSHFPIEGVPMLADRGLGGEVTGEVHLDGLHRDARVDADLGLVRGRLGAACFRGGQLRVSIGDGRLHTDARLDATDGSLHATADAAARWGDRIVPAIDSDRPIDAALDANNFRAASLLPFIKGAVDRLDGRIDANARIHVEPRLADGRMDGDIRLTHGTVEIPSLGQELHDVRARVYVRPWGTVRVDDVAARGTSGRLEASARAVLDGLALRNASATIHIPRGEGIPINAQGVSMGSAWGDAKIEATMTPDAKRVDARVEVPTLHVDLPPSTGHSVQTLDPAPGVKIGMHDANDRFVVLPLHPPEKPRQPGGTAARVEIALGRDVELRRDTSLRVMISGKPVIDVDDKTKVTGSVSLHDGRVEIFGKRMAITGGTIAFTGDASNPQLSITAQWDAPDQTRVFADVAGTPKKLDVKLRSEPPRSQDEILSLLVFGSPEGFAGAPQQSAQQSATGSQAAGAAAGLASGPVVQAFNKALSGISAIELQARLDTSQAQNPRPELELRLTNDVLLSIQTNLGIPPPDQPDRTRLTLDWRFAPRWSLATTIGDAGTSIVDFVWHHRY